MFDLFGHDGRWDGAVHRPIVWDEACGWCGFGADQIWALCIHHFNSFFLQKNIYSSLILSLNLKKKSKRRKKLYLAKKYAQFNNSFSTNRRLNLNDGQSSWFDLLLYATIRRLANWFVYESMKRNVRYEFVLFSFSVFFLPPYFPLALLHKNTNLFFFSSSSLLLLSPCALLLFRTDFVTCVRSSWRSYSK